MIAPGLLRSLTALALVPGTALSGAGFTAALGATAFASPAAAQQQPPPPSGPPSDEAVPLVFGEVLDVRVVNVEVVVTDKDGERVRGLGAKDFRLKVDGQEVPIDFFSEILGGAVVARERADDTKEVPALAPGQPVGTSYLVFIDDFFSIARDRDRVLERLEEQAKAMQPEDRMAVVAFDGQ